MTGAITFPWRWCFYVNIPVGVAALIVTSSVLNLPSRRVQHRIDYSGAGLLVAAVSALLLVTVWGAPRTAGTRSRSSH